jgi:hypothetical protein
MEPIGEESLRELRGILPWIWDRERESPITILVEGWAVYYYNGYWGSTDIDLITNNRTRRSLRYYLLNERGYQTDDETSYSVHKRTTAGDVVIDIAGRGLHGFEGRSEHLDMDMIDGRLNLANIEGVEVYIPDRSFLLLMKMKAAWDRGWRLDNGRSNDREHDMSKRTKDFSDILALIDPNKGSEEIDIRFIGDQLMEKPFLLSVLDEVPISSASAEKYGIGLSEAREYIEVFKDLVSNNPS